MEHRHRVRLGPGIALAPVRIVQTGWSDMVWPHLLMAEVRSRGPAWQPDGPLPIRKPQEPSVPQSADAQIQISYVARHLDGGLR